MSPGPARLPPRETRFPRVSGDEPPHVETPVAGEQFSPRERG